MSGDTFRIILGILCVLWLFLGLTLLLIGDSMDEYHVPKCDKSDELLDSDVNK